MNWNSNRLRICRTQVLRQIKNQVTGTTHILYIGENTPEELGTRSVFVYSQIPPNVEPGIYNYVVKLQYFCNPSNNLFGPIMYVPPSLAFTIEKSTNYSDSKQKE